MLNFRQYIFYQFKKSYKNISGLTHILFLLLILFVWVNEVYDFPTKLFSDKIHSANYFEATLETIFVTLIWFIMSFYLLKYSYEKYIHKISQENLNRFYYNIFNNIETVVLVIDKEKNIIFANNAFRKIFNNEIINLNQKLDSDKNSKIFTPKLHKLIDEIFESQKPFFYSTEDKLFKDEFNTLRGWIVPFYENNEISSLIFTAEDYSDILAKDKALEKQEKYYHNMFLNAPVPYFSLDSNGRFLEINEAWKYLSEYSEEQLLFSSFYDFLDRENNEKLKAFLSDIENSKKISVLELQFINASNKKISLLLNCKCEYNNKKILCVSFNNSDFSFLRDSLIKKEQHFKEIFTQLPIAILEADVNSFIKYIEEVKLLTKDKFNNLLKDDHFLQKTLKEHFRVIFANNGAKRLFETPNVDEINTLIYEIDISQLAPIIRTLIAKIGEECVDYSSEISILTKNHNRKFVLFNFNFYHTSLEENKTVISITDITKRVNQEKETEQKLQLEHMITSCISKMISYNPKKTDFIINESIQKIGSFFDVDKIGIFIIENEYISCKYQWFSNKEYSSLEKVKLDTFIDSNILKELNNNGLFYIENNIGDYPQFEQFCNILLLPIRIRDNLEGIIKIATTKSMKISSNLYSLLKMFAFSIGNVLVQKYYTEEVQRSENNLKEIINHIPFYIYAKDENGKYLFANKALQKFYNLEESELLNKNQVDLHTKKDEVENFYLEDKLTIQSGEEQIFLHDKLTDLSGNRRILKTIKSPINLQGTDSKAVLGISIDITNEVEKENKIIHLNETLKSLRKINKLTLTLNDPNHYLLRSMEIFSKNKFYVDLNYFMLDEKNNYRSICNDSKIHLEDINSVFDKQSTQTSEEIHVLSDTNNSQYLILSKYLYYNETNFGLLCIKINKKNYDEQELNLFNEISDDLNFAIHFIKSKRVLNELNSRLQQAVDIANISWWDWDTQKNRIKCSHKIVSNIGLKNIKEFRIDRILNIIHKNDLDRFKKELNDVLLKKKKLLDIKIRVYNVKEQILWLQLIGQISENNESGNIEKITGIVTDITSQMIYEKNLKESEKKYKIITETSPDVIMRFDRAYRHLFVNKSVEKSLPLKVEDFIGKTHAEIGFPKKMCEFWDNLIQQTFDTNRIIEKEFSIKGKENKDIYYEWRLVPERNENGEVETVLAIARDITEKKITEERQKYIENKFQHLYNEAPMGIVLLDEKGIIMEANELFQKWVGITNKELSKISFFEFFKNNNELIQNIENCQDKDFDNNYFKLELISPEINEFWTDVIVKKMYDEIGNFLYNLVLIMDKTAETDLEKTVMMLYQAIKDSKSVIVITDKNGLIQYANPQFHELTEYSVEEVLGKNPRIVQSGDTPKKIYEELWETILSGKTWSGRLKNKKKSGNFYWEYVVISPFRDSNNDINGFIAMKQDISHLVELEQELKESKKSLKELEENVPLSLFRASLDGTLLNVNSEFKKKFNINTIPTTKKLFDFFAQDKEIQIILDHLSMYKEISNLEIELDLPETSMHWGLFSCRKIKNGDDVFIDGTILDITKRKLAEKDLWNVKKMETIGTFVGGLAHDFNNILTLILGYTDLLEHSLEDENLIEFVKQIKISGERASDIVKQLMTYSRQDAGQKEVVNIYDVLKEAVSLMKRTLTKNIEILENYKIHDMKVRADKNQLFQIIMNLIVNAQHAMEGKDGILSIELDKVNISQNSINPGDVITPGYFAQISIKDNGCGIPEEHLSKIFEPFFTTKKVGEGTGLGLANVFGIVNSHHGKIVCNSKVGVGTEFIIYLPLEKSDIIVSKDSFSNHLIQGSQTLIICDDEVEVGNAISRNLKYLGYDVHYFDKPMDAYEFFKEKQDEVDALITDLKMPIIDGDKLIKMFREVKSDIPTILFTGYSDVITVNNYKDFGIDYFFYKPVTLSSLSRALNEMFSLKNED